jgi:L-asparaginase
MSQQFKSSVLLIYTGGTIGMKEDPKTGALKPINFKYLLKQIPELQKFNVHIESYSLSPSIDSSNMQPSKWIELCKIIENEYNKYNGFVILHGSDTMAYTASALSFMLQNLKKPVILTGSQLPIGKIRTDGKENLITSIELAASHENGKPIIQEVAIYFEYKLYRGNRTKKFNSEHFDAFISPNYPILAKAGINIEYNKAALMKSNGSKKFTINTKLNYKVAVLTLFPGISKDIIGYVLQSPDAEAVVLLTYGSGNAPTHAWFIEKIKKAVANNKIILNVSQCMTGKVIQEKYETGKMLQDAGVVAGLDITLEAALTKLMFLMGNYSDKKVIKKLLTQSLVGELTN